MLQSLISTKITANSKSLIKPRTTTNQRSLTRTKITTNSRSLSKKIVTNLLKTFKPIIKTSINNLIIQGVIKCSELASRSIYSHKNVFISENGAYTIPISEAVNYKVTISTAGTYQINCSGLVHLVLTHQNIAMPIKEIIDYLPSDFPLSILDNIPSPIHYAFFLTHKPNKQYWELISDARSLQPGDFVIYTKHSIPYTNHTTLDIDEYNDEIGQHIMIVTDTPKIDTIKPPLLWVPIFDSTKTHHGQTDKRYAKPTKDGGIGKGTIGLELDNDNKPISIIWRDYSNDHSYKPTTLRRNILMTRIIKI